MEEMPQLLASTEHSLAACFCTIVILRTSCRQHTFLVAAAILNLPNRIWRTIEWTLFRALLIPAGYDKYIFIFYVVAGVVREQ